VPCLEQANVRVQYCISPIPRVVLIVLIVVTDDQQANTIRIRWFKTNVATFQTTRTIR